jgi:hypothetical protein
VDETAPPTTGRSTEPQVADHRDERRSHRIRQVALAGFAVFVLLGLSSVLGVRSRTATADGDAGTRVELTYAQVARPALAVPYRVRISRPDGFSDPIEIRISREWLDSFDENGVHPEPSEATTDGADVVWTFDPPPGQVFTVSLDTRVEPGVQWRRQGTTTVTTGGERIDVHHTMWILP